MKKYITSSIIVLCILASLFYVFKIVNKDKGREVKTFTAFFTTYGDVLEPDNEIKEIIAEKIGAKCEETWLTNGTVENALNYYIASGEYPDFISGEYSLYEAKALVPIDEYWEKYPNIYNYMSQEDWDKFRQDDGHIYWIPQFGVIKNKDSEVIHDGEAFWIQTRVLKWAGYPDIRTMDEYFDLIERYMEANPTMENGTPNIPYTILCDDWRYFCLENAPQFLDGYPNDGSVSVDPVNKKVIDYNVTDTAKAYFKKLNEEYKKGFVDPESFTSTYEEYLNKLGTGAVLGMIDQWWDFNYNVTPSFSMNNLDKEGCNYVPLPITISREVENKWHVNRSSELDASTGLAVTVSCEDVEGAFKFINDLLDEDITILRFWGVESEDYSVDEDGVMYLNEEQYNRFNDRVFKLGRYCNYAYFPRYEGLTDDGKNAYIPEYQQRVFFDGLAEDIKECLSAYDCMNYVDMLGTCENPGPWFPMYSYSTQLTYTSDSGRVWKSINDLKHQWLPQVVMAEDFETKWNEYMEAYNACQPEIFLDDMQRELERRIEDYE